MVIAKLCYYGDASKRLITKLNLMNTTHIRKLKTLGN